MIWRCVAVVAVCSVWGSIRSAVADESEDATVGKNAVAAAESELFSQPARESDCDCNRVSRSIFNCPVYPIAVYQNGTLYFADHFDPTCDDAVSSSYAFGDYNWPWQICPDDCAEDVSRASAASGEKPAWAGSSQDFQGLPEAVGDNYMHRRPADGSDSLVYAPGQRHRKSCFPGGPAQRCCRVDARLNCMAIRFTIDGDNRYAKVLRMETNVELAAGVPDKDVWRPTYVAFELAARPPATFDVQTIAVEDVTPVSNEFIRRGLIALGVPGEKVNVLILLAQ